MENSAHSLECQTSISSLSSIQISKSYTYRFSNLKEIIEKEMGIRDATILDDKGIDLTTMHNDDLV